MNAREYLTLNKQIEQMVAFTAVMKGDLKKETEQAQQALDALGGAQKIESIRASLEQAKAVFEDHKLATEEVFKEVKRELEQEQENVKKAFSDLQLEKEKISNLKSDFVSEYDAFLNYRDSTLKDLAKAQVDLNTAIAKVTAEQVDLAKGFADVTARETKVTEKLAAIKALAR